MIPATLIRTVPQHSAVEAEQFWADACALHPTWGHLTFRDPIDPDEFPITAPHWDYCKSGAQLAGLVRLEALIIHGGIYLDSDVEVYRPLDSLLTCSAFAGWEDPSTVPDAVLGAEPAHPAILQCLALALERLHSTSPDWRTGPGAWSTGPGVTTTILPDRPDVLLLPPGAFYPYHWTQRETHRDVDHHSEQPWAFGAHHWAASWL